MDKSKDKVFAASLSVASNVTLTISKIGVGISIGSISVLSEALHSAIDLVASLIALYAVKTSGKPADREHPFGHGKIENISGAVEAILIFIAAGWIIFESVKKLISPHVIESASWGVGVMFISSVLNFFVSQYLFKVSHATDSVALEADAWHLRTDVYTSLGVMVGLGLMWFGSAFFPAVDLSWLDPVAALAVALLIIRAAYELTVKATKDLLDESLPPEELHWLKSNVFDTYPNIKSCHSLKTRKSGPSRFIEFHLAVESAMSVEDSHAITEQLEKMIKARFPDANVIIHIEPCDDEHCHQACEQGCKLT